MNRLLLLFVVFSMVCANSQFHPRHLRSEKYYYKILAQMENGGKDGIVASRDPTIERNCFFTPKNEELAEEFMAYSDCLKRAELDVGNEAKIKVIYATRGQDVILPCFTCVSPEDGLEIDSTYKPSAGLVGRMLKNVEDFFKEKFLRSSYSMPDKNRWKFDWEFAMLGRGFVPLSNMHFSASDSITDRILRFVRQDDADFKLGDRYELVLKNVDANNTGFFRCINRHGRNIISNMYFVEVVNHVDIVSISGELNNNEIPEEVQLTSQKFEEEKLNAEPKASQWSECSYCGSDRGEQMRSIRCYIEPMLDHEHLPNNSKFVTLFDKIPCTSSLVPLEIRNKIKAAENHVVYVQIKPCFVPCTKKEQIEREINSSEDLGELRTLDYLPAGEFIFGNLLPRLLPPVMRRVQLVTEGDPLILTCQKLIDKDSGVHWYSLNRGPLQFENITETFSGRAYFDAEANLVFDRFAAEDDDEYFCYSSNNILLGTFHIRVVDNDKSQEVVEVILMTIPKFGYSHMNFLGKVADVLVEEGHDVTFLLPNVIPQLPSNASKLAKVVLVPSDKKVHEIVEESAKSGAVANLWTHSANSYLGIMWSVDLLGKVSYYNTKSWFDNKELIEQFKNEQFDIGITELFDFSGMAIFHSIGLKNVIAASSMTIAEISSLATGAPILPSFVPGSQAFTDDSGNLISRLQNLYMTYYSYKFQEKIMDYTQKAMNEHYGENSPQIFDLIKDITWFITNSDPLFDFPKPLPHNIVEVAGIGVAKVNALPKNWDELLNRRSKNVLVSFGSIASANTMPKNVKQSLVETFEAFPDVTFIWKFDDSEEKLTARLENVEVVSWMPQNDLLADNRITLFWTHGGLGSLMESAHKGVPLLVVPIFGDQMRNAQISKRHGAGVIFDKMELGNSQKLIKTLKEMLENPSYKENALLLAKILATNRISPRQKLLEVIEFAGSFGPMPRFTSNSKHFSLIKYYNADLLLYFIVLVLFTIWIFSRIVTSLLLSQNAEKRKFE
ncbi:unnamed protein product [Caenorhabditis bovis]|uniref:glucuronosyltransferase n=1 Tax=Caenorhabditis bovis TaxID=2654633 RepID=A0A8S1EWV3_9PELO|nr:unnamed protein product [Caenorhabditis bovis]